MNINADLTVPVCCLVFNRDHVVSTNYLASSIEEINKGKEDAEICRKCMQLNLPHYSMGFNKKEWLKYASQKRK